MEGNKVKLDQRAEATAEYLKHKQWGNGEGDGEEDGEGKRSESCPIPRRVGVLHEIGWGDAGNCF